MALKFYQSYDVSVKDFDDLFCRECSRNGSSVDTLNFCVGCESLFCLQCLQDHKRDDVDSQWIQNDEDKTVNENNIQSSSHKPETNNNIRYSRATKVHPSEAKNRLKKSLMSLQKQLHTHIEHDRTENLNRLQKVREHAENKMSELRMQVMDWLDEIQTRLSDAVLDLHTETEKVYSLQKEPVNILMAKTEAALNIIQTTETGGEDLASFTEKTIAEAMTLLEDPDYHYRNILKGLEKAELDNVDAILTESMEELVVNINSLAYSLTTNAAPDEPVVRSYDVQGERDTTLCDINGSCIMPDRSVVLTDWNNTNIKLLSPTYEVTDTCDVPGIPWAVCCTRNKEVAVSLHLLQKIQFVSVIDSRLQLTHSFKVRQKCRGVSYADDKVYVACGGGGIMEGTGQVHVYSREGNLFQVFKLDSLGNTIFSCPQHLAISEDSSELYIADKNFGIVVVNLLDKSPAESSRRTTATASTGEAKGICVTADTSVLLCDYILNNIAVYREGDGKITKIHNLLDKKFNVCNPQSLSYDKLDNHLVVTCGNTNFIQVFEMAIHI